MPSMSRRRCRANSAKPCHPRVLESDWRSGWDSALPGGYGVAAHGRSIGQRVHPGRLAGGVLLAVIDVAVRRLPTLVIRPAAISAGVLLLMHDLLTDRPSLLGPVLLAAAALGRRVRPLGPADGCQPGHGRRTARRAARTGARCRQLIGRAGRRAPAPSTRRGGRAGRTRPTDTRPPLRPSSRRRGRAGGTRRSVTARYARGHP